MLDIKKVTYFTLTNDFVYDILKPTTKEIKKVL